MVSVFIALLALTPSPNPQPPDPAPLDLRCYQLMAQLAEDADPRISAAGLTGAQYFLGRIDAASPDFEPAASPQQAPVSQAEQARLIGQCGSLMGAGGRDFRAIGRSLAGPRDTI